MIKKILVAIDGSAQANNAMDFALNLAQKYSAKVLLLAVVPPVFLPMPSLNVVKSQAVSDAASELKNCFSSVLVTAEEKAKKEAEAKAKAEAEAKAKAEAEAKAKSEAAEAQAKAKAKEKEELLELRRKRAEARATHAAEHAGEGEEIPKTAAKDQLDLVEKLTRNIDRIHRRVQ